MKRVFSHIGNRNRKKKPLVMAFVGPSGHGKTEMAIQMGDLLSVKHTVIDCAQIRDRMDLLGASNGYTRSDEGSQLNNFLGDNSEKRAVIFLDEFDKTEREVRNALLVVMEKGNYIDRRYNCPVDCSNTIWIIASNLGTETINDSYKKNMKELDDEARDQIDLTSIQMKLRDVFFSVFGDPFTSRINLIVPFLPFEHSEQAVVLHKFMLDFQDHVRDRINLREDIKRYIGHINLDLIEDGVFCSKLAKIYYVVPAGARSLLPVVDLVEDKLVHEYMETKILVTETMNDKPLLKFTARLVPTTDDRFEIAVFKEEEKE